MTLRQLRERAGLTQDEAAIVSRLSQGTISAVERGANTNIKIDTIRAIAKAYRCEVIDVIEAIDETMKAVA